MISVTAAGDNDRCTACGDKAAVVIHLIGGFPLCRNCAHTLLNNLQRKEAPAHANSQ